MRCWRLGENLTIRARQYKGLKPNRVSDLIDRLGLSAFQKQKYGTLSGGQKRRVDIARALLHGPDLLFLDEPTTGLDIQTRKSIWDLLYQLQREEGWLLYWPHIILTKQMKLIKFIL